MIKLDKYLRQKAFYLKDEEVLLKVPAGVNNALEDEPSYLTYCLKAEVNLEDRRIGNLTYDLYPEDFKLIFKIEPTSNKFIVTYSYFDEVIEIGRTETREEGKKLANDYLQSILIEMTLKEANKYLITEGEY
ncbi:hypothetical protein CPT_Maine_208 [Staphylococcus phage Maine]|nr:hypothetical protein CPT_Maine_208 [Staphylococcus phage Maine]